MHDDPDDTANLLRIAAHGDAQARAHLFERYRPQLKKMVRLRLDRRLLGRIDESGIVQEALLAASHRLSEYLANPLPPFYLWLRRIASNILVKTCRTYHGSRSDDAEGGIFLYRGALPVPTAQALAAQLLGIRNSPERDLVKAQMRMRLQDALNTLAPLDREILALRCFEQLSNDEAAQVLELEPSDARKRHIHALARLQRILCRGQLAPDRQ